LTDTKGGIAYAKGFSTHVTPPTWL